MPRVRTALTRGVVTVLGSPVLVIAPILYVLVVWLVLIAVGYQGPFAPLANLLALPPIGTSLDATLATSLFGLQGGLFGIIIFLVVRAIALALLTAAVVEALEDGVRHPGVPASGAPRAPRDVRHLHHRGRHPHGVELLRTAARTGVRDLAAGRRPGDRPVSLRVRPGHRRRRGAHACPIRLARSIRAARIPGTGNLTLAALYVVPVDRRDRRARRARQPDGGEPRRSPPGCSCC